MHPFGMNIGGADKVALEDWIAAEHAELADVELPEGPDDFVLSVRRWIRYLQPRFRPMAYAWIAAINRARRVPLSASSLKKLGGMMRADVNNSAAGLWDAKPATVDAWCKWYPTWIDGLIAERAKTDRLFLLPAEQHHRAKRNGMTRDDVTRKQSERDRELGARLYKHLETHGGICRWRPGLLAVKISSRQRGRRVDAARVREMAAALVRLDVARWRKRVSGQPWALQLTATLNNPKLNH